MITYTPSPMTDAELLAWVGVTGAGLVTYSGDDPLRLDWQTKWKDWQNATLRMRDLIVSGGTVKVKNTSGSSIDAGPVKVVGYNAAADCLLIDKATNANNAGAAQLILSTALANNATGLGQLSANFTSALNTSGAAVGDPVYLGAAGALTLALPTAANVLIQIVGHVKTLANPGVVRGFCHMPQQLIIRLQQTDNATIDNGATGGKLRTISDPQRAEICNVGTQTVPNNTPTAITFGALTYDVGGLTDIVGSPDQIKIVKPGLYLLTLSGDWDTASDTGRRGLSIYNNGAQLPGIIQRLLMTTGFLMPMQVTGTAVLAANDVITGIAFQTSGSINDIGGVYLRAAKISD